jgi:hypothetical protein
MQRALAVRYERPAFRRPVTRYHGVTGRTRKLLLGRVGVRRHKRVGEATPRSTKP